MAKAKAARIRCTQCEALMINGIFCHELGCPNTKARYDESTGPEEAREYLEETYPDDEDSGE
jgi:phage FluMu protein Com